MSKITKDNWEMYCEHANEMPYFCPCDEECGCRRWGSCKKRNPSSIIDESIEERLSALEDKVDRILNAFKMI